MSRRWKEKDGRGFPPRPLLGLILSPEELSSRELPTPPHNARHTPRQRSLVDSTRVSPLQEKHSHYPLTSHLSTIHGGRKRAKLTKMNINVGFSASPALSPHT